MEVLFTLVLQQMVIFVLLMCIGALAKRYKIFTPENQSQLTKLVLNIAYPAMILSGVTGRGAHIEGMELAYALAVITAMLLLLLICAKLLPVLLRYPAKQRGIVNVMCVCTNIGFMGVPLIDNIYGKDALIYVTLLLIPCNLLFYSYVIASIKASGSQAEPFHLRSLANTGMAACVLAIMLYFTDIQLPYILTKSLDMLGSMTGPLAMMLLGSFLKDTEWKRIINGKIIIFTLMKMLMLPIAILLLLEQFVHNTYLLAGCMAVLATSSGNVLPLLAAMYNKDAYPVAVQGVTLTNAAAVVTLPLVALVTGLG